MWYLWNKLSHLTEDHVFNDLTVQARAQSLWCAHIVRTDLNHKSPSSQVEMQKHTLAIRTYAHVVTEKHTSSHPLTYIYIYIYTCVCVIFRSPLYRFLHCMLRAVEFDIYTNQVFSTMHIEYHIYTVAYSYMSINTHNYTVLRISSYTYICVYLLWLVRRGVVASANLDNIRPGATWSFRFSSQWFGTIELVGREDKRTTTTHFRLCSS